jgi:dienelactone hydrolase
VRERPLVFGQDKGLVGIVTEPTREKASNRPACILVNAGLIHRVGPNRLYVNLARQLADAGLVVLRFDLSGRGDSAVRKDAVSFTHSSVEEIRAAMDVLQASRKCERFFVAGICSGAINALHAAIADSRVAGGVMIDGPAYPTTGYYLRYYGRRLLSAESWRNTLAGRNVFGRVLRKVVVPGPGADDAAGDAFEGDASLPSKTQATELLSGVISRGGKLLFIFSGSWTTYNHRNQFRSAFPSLMRTGAVDVEYFPDADHTFTGLHNQRRVIATIVRFVEARWPAGPKTP